MIFCTTVKSNFLKTSRRPLLNRREWNLFGKTQQTLRALKCGESNKQARLHVFTRTGTVRLCYMCLNAHCACVTCVYTYQSANAQQDTKGTTDGGRIFGSKQQGRFFLHLDTRVLQVESLPEQWLLLPFVELVSLKTIEICNWRHLGINYFKATRAPDVFL